MDTIRFFSADRLASYKNEDEHKANFLLMQKIAPKLGIIEIVSRNLIFQTLKTNAKLDILEQYKGDCNEINSLFISKQTFGFWVKILNESKAHNDLVDLKQIDFRKYSKFNIKYDWRNYQKVRISYDLLVKIRNRAFHFENLYKLNQPLQTPRISTNIKGIVTGIMPEMFESFIDDILSCFNAELNEYLG